MLSRKPAYVGPRGFIEDPPEMPPEFCNHVAPGRPVETRVLGHLEAAILEWMRVVMGVSQRELARVCGISQTAYNLMVKRKRGFRDLGDLLGGYLVARRATSSRRLSNEERKQDEHVVIADSAHPIWWMLYHRKPRIQRGGAWAGWDLLNLNKSLEKPSTILEVDCFPDRLTMLFDLRDQTWERKADYLQKLIAFAQAHPRARYWPSRKDDDAYRHHLNIAGACHIGCAPRYGGLFGRVEFYGRALRSGEAAQLWQRLVRPSVAPNAMAISRLDWTVEYTTTAPLSPHIIPHDRRVGKCETNSPNCDELAANGISTTHGKRQSKRRIVNYPKDLEKLDKRCNITLIKQRSHQLNPDCICHDPTLWRDEHSEDGAGDVACPVCEPRHGGPYIHRCEGADMPGPGSNRHPLGYAYRAPNVFEPHVLIDVRVVDDPLHRVILAAARLDGSTDILTELCDVSEQPSLVRNEFNDMFRRYAVLSSHLPQPQAIKESHRPKVQKIIDDVLGAGAGVFAA